MSMNPEVKADWLAVLRSRIYKRGQGKLRTLDGGFCCLGVLCDRYLAATGKGKWVVKSECVAFLTSGWDGSTSYLPHEVRVWAGLDCNNPMVASGALTTLAQWNDATDSGRPRFKFSDIADVIEDML